MGGRADIPPCRCQKLRRAVIGKSPFLPLDGGAVRQIFDDGMDTAEQRPPGFRPVPLFPPILLFQWQVGGDIDLCVTGRLVVVPGRERQRINVQVVQHILDGDLTVKFLEHQHILPVVAVKGNPL